MTLNPSHPAPPSPGPAPVSALSVAALAIAATAAIAAISQHTAQLIHSASAAFRPLMFTLVALGLLSVALAALARARARRLPRQGLMAGFLGLWLGVIASTTAGLGLVTQYSHQKVYALQQQELADLRAISAAFSQYRSNHNDRFPTHVQELVQSGLLPADRLMPPTSGGTSTSAATSQEANPSEGTRPGALPGGASGGGYRYGRFWFVYDDLLPLQPKTAPPILAFGIERHIRQQSLGRCVLYADGRAEVVTPSAFEQQIAAQNGRRVQLGLPPIDLSRLELRR